MCQFDIVYITMGKLIYFTSHVCMEIYFFFNDVHVNFMDIFIMKCMIYISVDLLLLLLLGNKVFEPNFAGVGWCYSITVETPTRMAPIDDAKTTRTTAKWAVTVVVCRLGSCVEMGMDSMVSMAKNLDLAYFDLVLAAADYREMCDQEEVDDTYRVVNGLNLEQHEAGVKTLYKDSVTAYRNYMSSPPAQGAISHPSASTQSVSGTYHLRREIFPIFLASARTGQSSKLFGKS